MERSPRRFLEVPADSICEAPPHQATPRVVASDSKSCLLDNRGRVVVVGRQPDMFDMGHVVHEHDHDVIRRWSEI